MKSLIENIILYCFISLFVGSLSAQTALSTSFEPGEGYTTGTINNKNNWKVTSGTGEIVNMDGYVYEGSQALKVSANASTLQVDHIAFASNATGLSGDVYIDFRIKLKSLPTVNLAATGYDLGTNTHRSFMIEFQPNGKIKLYDGSSGWATQPNYTVDTWTRISIKIDNAGAKYQVAIDGVVLNKLFSFREIRNSATEFDYHSIRFSIGSGTCDAAIDNIYAGTTPVQGISFQESSTERTVSITQPTYGTISLNPQKAKYQLNEQVSASISVPEHYIFGGWSGDLSGTENPKTFTVEKNMSIGASITIDPLNPPALSAITVHQPTGATITLQPQQTSYYHGTTVTAQLSLQSGYQFDNWSGSLSGSANPVSFIVNGPMTIGAIVSEIQVTSTKRTVSNATQFKEAIAAMNPGDTIVALDGTYNLGGVKVTRGGSGLKPIVVISKNLHGAKITGASSFTLSGISYVTFEGFDFNLEPVSTIFKMEGCSYVRITRNQFKMKKLSDTQSSKWITVGDVWENPVCNSHHNRIDHNLFDGKYDAGAWVVIDGSHGAVPDISKYDRIDHNIFRNNTPRVANEKETIRMGVSDLSNLNAYTVVENNLFEDCDGDPEIVSVKSCSNIVRNNTFRRCLGTLSLRHGNNSIVEGNYFFGEGKTALFEGNTIGCGGVRVYGMNHKIINNYFEGLTGSKWDAAITITNGDVTNTSSSLSSHFLPENVVFAFNTLVNNVSDIEIGFDNNGKYSRAPKNCKIDNNIVIANQNPIIKSFSSTSLAGVSFSNNIMYSTETSTLGLTGINEAQIKTIDPQLVKTKCRTYNSNCYYETPFETYKLTALSPAINASIGYETVLTDAEGQPATGIRDIGADEFNPDNAITNGPFSELHAGPTASETYLYETSTSTSVRFLPPGKISVSPNPFTAKTQITFPENTSGPVTVKVFNTTGHLVSSETISHKSGISRHEIQMNQTGLFFCIIETGQEKHTIKLISK